MRDPWLIAKASRCGPTSRWRSTGWPWAAREEASLFLSVTSGFRSDAEQAVLFAAHPDPKWVAPPGESLHRYATELDLRPPGAHRWLAASDQVRLSEALFLGAVALGDAVSPQFLASAEGSRDQ